MASLKKLMDPSPNSSPRISFSAEFLDENNFISICPKEKEREMRAARTAQFEFLSGNGPTNVITADELFSEGRLLPSWEVNHAEKIKKISLKVGNPEFLQEIKKGEREKPRIHWFLDDDPSPRPPKCTVLWKELLRLKKQRAPPLCNSSASSEMLSGDERKEGADSKEKAVKRTMKGLERTRPDNVRIRPVIHVPISTQGKNSALPPLFSLRKGKIVS